MGLFSINQEHTGACIREYYYEVGAPLMGSPGITIARRDEGIVQVIHEAPGARLSTLMDEDGLNQRHYMRFLGLAAELTERDYRVLGFEPDDRSVDLVVACPSLDDPLTYLLVPS